MRTILLIVLGLFIAQKLAAQSDSLIIKLDNYGQMIILSSNLITEKKKSIGLDSSYRKFYEDFKKVDKSKFDEKGAFIKYSSEINEPHYQTIRIENGGYSEDVYYFHEEKQQSVLPKKFRVELAFERTLILFVNSLDDLDKIARLDLDSLYLQSLYHIQSQGLSKKSTYKIFYSYENNTLDKSANLIYQERSNDYILLNPMIGMSVISSRIAPEWGASMDLDFGRKGSSFQKFGVDYVTMYLSDKDDFSKISSYGFLGLNYYIVANKAVRYSHKLSFAYLVNKSGNDFNGTTWNAFWTVNIKDVGFKIGCFYTKNTAGKYIAMPSIGLNFIL